MDNVKAFRGKSAGVHFHENRGNPGGLEFLKKAGSAVQTLNLYGAAGIVAFGWTLGRLLHFESGRYAPLWFCAALFIYNLDRLKTDPADAINTPRRSLAAARLRKISLAVAATSAAALVALPVFQRDWLMLLLTASGALLCVNHTLAPLGFRLKDVPLLKTFFAPTLVAAAFVVPPLLQQGMGGHPVHCTVVLAWTWCVLLFNMILCDLRDIEGDRRTGIRSLPVLFGPENTRRSLAALLGLVIVLSIAAAQTAPTGEIQPWLLLAALVPAYLAGLLAALRKPMPEFFYEWWVEGILFVPALVYSLAIYSLAR